MEVCPVELPGRGIRFKEPLLTHLQSLLQALGPAIVPYLDKPFAFFGHSMGALISYELAQTLSQNYGFSPISLFVSACRAPQLPTTKPPIHTLSDAAFLKELRRLNGTPEEVLQNTELMQLRLPMLRADFTVLETYTYTPKLPLHSPITAFGGWHDQEVSHDELKAWRLHTNVAFSLQMLPGNHFFIHSAQSHLLQLLCQTLNQRL
ncbi:MAG: thioesterase [Cyanothece sp. SIO1E1]|nr:thioesterase [Cyanothece sp. SIO1E1]